MPTNVEIAIKNLQDEITNLIKLKLFARAHALIDIVSELTKHVVPLDNELTDNEINILQNEGIVLCIKTVRERIGMSLYDAKNVIDNYIATMGLVRVEKDGKTVYIPKNTLDAIEKGLDESAAGKVSSLGSFKKYVGEK